MTGPPIRADRLADRDDHDREVTLTRSADRARLEERRSGEEALDCVVEPIRVGVPRASDVRTDLRLELVEVEVLASSMPQGGAPIRLTRAKVAARFSSRGYRVGPRVEPVGDNRRARSP